MIKPQRSRGEESARRALSISNHLKELVIVIGWVSLVTLMGCDNSVDPENNTQEPDMPPTFYEEALDMRTAVERDQDPGEVARILGEFGDSCEGNLDCAEGWCVNTEEGALCTRTCLGSDCPTGWSCRAVTNNSGDATLICVPLDERLCKPCVADTDCPAGLCYLLDGEQICGSSCETDDDCPDSYQCDAVGPGGEPLCTPISASCSCGAGEEGEARICERTSDAGSCYGRQTCEGERGWSVCTAAEPIAEICNQIDDDCNGITDDIPILGSACEREAIVDGEMRRCEGINLCTADSPEPQCSALVPSTELCNFLDDDCDGEVDEGFEGREEACVVGEGICQSYGVFVCNETPRPAPGEEGAEEWTPVVCNATPGTPGVETCDRLDNDCDGQADEDFPTLGEICSVGEGVCRRSSITRCNEEGTDVVCEVREGEGEEERCDGADNDCDGLIDEDFTELNQLCVDGVGACERRGLLVCAPDGLSLACNASAAAPEEERCDALDNDCDGQVDELYPTLGELCAVGEGLCRQSGVYRCDATGEDVLCSAEEGLPTPELCDALDNDCDGSTDEDFVGLNTLCADGVGACERRGLFICAPDGLGLNCNATATEPSDELCDGADNDCDGEVDEEFSGIGEVCAIGVGACQAVGVTRCALDGASVRCTAAEGLPSEERCDSLDNDCDGLVDETFADLNTSCAAGVGLCERRGLFVCAADELSTTCSVEADEAAEERCDDLDNDCDGEIDEGFIGLNEPCLVGQGVCQAVGVNRCDATGEGLVCSATEGAGGAERCDSLDNDCDGETDEDFVGINEPCVVGQGSCQAVGVARCDADGAGVSCSVEEGQAIAELCDSVDNDCDGRVDEDFVGLNESCVEGVGVCQRRGLFVCAEDRLSNRCNVNAAAADVELCDDLDNDCDGSTDEGFAGIGEPCVVGQGACQAVGVTRCSPDGAGAACSVSAGQPTAELCDSVDNDCDGSIDETFADLNESCADGVGACQRRGIFVCAADGQSAACNASAAAEEVEVCDDLDNDCDGETDEDFVGLGEPCVVGQGTCQAVGVTRCDPNGAGAICSVSEGQAIVELCDSLDNDCDGRVDEDFADLNESCVEGVGVCQRRGLFVCAADGQSTACNASAAAADVELCDDLDNDCDGVTDEGFAGIGEPCVVGQGACQAVGVTRCSPDGAGAACSVSAGQPTAELCDSVDNDCDGSVDETFADLNESCVEGVGTCQRRGLFVCAADGQSTACNASAATADVELCDDLDNDCDGVTDEGFAGIGEPCVVGQGACQAVGVTRCSPDGAGAACSVSAGQPTAELCDSVDNDCDGSVDETFADLNESCVEGVGTCQRRGLFVCAADGQSTACNASAAAADVELCDDLDNDCDGVTDEGFAGIGEPCVVGQGACQAVGVTRCSPDGAGAACSVSAGQPTAELCDSVDNDCDGSVDETFADLNESCVEGVGTCQRRGLFVCAADGQSTACNASAAAADVELCDDLDNDCDGVTDEGFAGIGEPCVVGQGACQAVGVTRCSPDGAGAACSVSAGQPTAELCDSVDNDCDGSVDETFADLNESCVEGVGACQRRGLSVCAVDGLSTTCNASAGPAEVEVCDSVDNDCDGESDEGFAPRGEPCVVGLGACQAVGVTRCDLDGSGVSCSAAEGEPSVERCDNLDNDCDGSIDEAYALVGERCEVGLGLCKRTGVYGCDPGNPDAPEVCDAEVVAGSASDTCDYQDDDCDGQVDEDFLIGGQYLQINNCGACGSDCATLWTDRDDYYVIPTCEVINNLAQCSYTCEAGHFDLDGLSNNGCEFSPDADATYVKPTQYGGADIAECGDFDSPCATLSFAVSIANGRGQSRLRVAEGVYRETFELPNGFEVLGGHIAGSWVRNPNVAVSHIDSRGVVSVDEHRYGVIARGIDQPTTLDGFLITAETPSAGGNSYGVYIIDSGAALVITNNRITTGDGGRGADGSVGNAGANGVIGASGNSSFGADDPVCVGELNAGGLGGARTCQGVDVSGGVGAGAGCPFFGTPAGSAADGAGPSPGLAGITAWSWRSEDQSTCIVSGGPRDAGTGVVGGNGTDGAGGASAVDSLGLVVNNHWRGDAGNAGALANPGSGGGGGGGAAGIEILYTPDPAFDIGATGGGGGSGACGGEGGAGGGSGGGSFGVFVTYSVSINGVNLLPIITDNVISRGFGGAGGSGGPGGPGGRGGLAGAGGVAGAGLYQAFCSLQGGDGGKGGDGGDGGGGAGGQGGASFDFYVHNTSGQSRAYETLNLSLTGADVETGGTGGVGGVSPNADIGLGAAGLKGSSGLIIID